MLKIYVPRYSYNPSEGVKLSLLINKSEIVRIIPHQDNPNACIVVYKAYPGSTSHWQGALATSTTTIVTYQSLEEVLAQFGEAL